MNCKYEEKNPINIMNGNKTVAENIKRIFFSLEINTENSIVVRKDLEGNGNFYSFRKLQS